MLLRALELYDFDTVMFPINWHMNMAHGMGSRIAKAVKEKGIGLLAIKSMVEKAWEEEDHIDEVIQNPLTDEDVALLKNHLPQVTNDPFYDEECYMD